MQTATLRGLTDEFEKIALDPLQTSLLSAGIGSAVELGVHGPWGKGGRSFAEMGSEKGLQQKDPKKKLKALKEHEAIVRQAESGGLAGAAGVAPQIAGMYGAGKLLAPSLMKGERAAVQRFGKTTPQAMEALSKHMGPGAKNFHVLENGGIGQALHIPKGGMLPFKKLRDWIERPQLRNRGISDALIDRGHAEGLSLIPANAGIHVGAHELGHGQFGATGIGRVTRHLRLPAGIGGAIGANYMATRDPDSKAAKWAPAVGALGVAPILGEEAMASFNALRAMKRAGHSPEAMSVAKKQLGKAWGTYGLALGLPAVAAPYAIRKLRQHRMAKREKQGLTGSDEYRTQIQKLKEKLKRQAG